MEGERTEKRMQPPAAPEEQDEEEKMEKFFATIRSIRAAKERWREEPVVKKMRREDKAVWTPSFQLEDFMQEILIKSPERSPAPSKKDDHEDDDEDNIGDDSLNLKLSL